MVLNLPDIDLMEQDVVHIMGCEELTSEDGKFTGIVTIMVPVSVTGDTCEECEVQALMKAAESISVLRQHIITMELH